MRTSTTGTGTMTTEIGTIEINEILVEKIPTRIKLPRYCSHKIDFWNEETAVFYNYQHHYASISGYLIFP
jgi:hypothetical protein